MRNMVSDQAGGTGAGPGGEGLIAPVHTTHSHIAPMHSDKNSNAAIPEGFQYFRSLQNIMQCIISSAEKKETVPMHCVC